MSARASPEKIERARQLEAEGVPRAEICKIVGMSAPTLIRWLGKLPRQTAFTDCHCGNHAFAVLDHGQAVLVDRGDATRYADTKLFLMKAGDSRQRSPHWYVARSDWPGPHVRIHREIMGATTGEIVDHKSRNTLDNRRENLRKATPSANGANTRPKGGSSRFKGVHWSKKEGRWIASIMVARKTTRVGRYAIEIEAAQAYDMAALQLFGEYAQTNKSLGLL
jgi:hypothetical protein